MRDLYRAFAEARRLNRKRGFTLIELLVVIAIIAILAAIAIPQFAKYRVRAFNSAAESDLKNVRTTMEAIYANFQTYGTMSVSNATENARLLDTTAGIDENVSLSRGVHLDLYSARTHYMAGTYHEQGDRQFCADSDVSNIYYTVVPNPPPTSTGVTNAGNYQQNDCPGNPL